jgi:Fe-S-cluster containining protein
MNNKLLPDNYLEMLSKISGDISPGLIYNHTRINDNTKKTLQATSFLYALIELLNEKGILTIEELDARKRKVAERLVRNFAESGLGLMYQDPEMDKYHFEQEAKVDCESRLSACKAVCCKIPFALSRQDVEEGIVRWNFGRPYMIAHGTEGYCVHLNRDTFKCSVHENRPVPCRGFDCRDNEKWRVWNDYDRRILNPELMERISHSNGKFYSYTELK